MAGPVESIRGGTQRVADVVEIRADVMPFDDALDETPRSPREVRDVGVLFVELAHPDSLAVSRSASEVGAILGAFFKAVSGVADAYGGYAERRDLCAVRCVFGAPASSTRAADATLAGGRDLRDRLVEELSEVEVGIGISVGASVGGWIQQSVRRFEPLILCAPTSEARGLCKLAGRGGTSVLASERALARASSTEARRWSSAAPAAATGTPAATLSANPAGCLSGPTSPGREQCG